MGNLTEKVYITGERDYRYITFDRPLLYATNIGLRYFTIYTTKPELVVNYDQELIVKWLYVSNPEILIDQTNDPMCLRKHGNTEIVLIECDRNTITGNLSNYNVIKSKIVPIVKNYALK